MTVGQAYLNIYQFPTTSLPGFWGPVIVLFIYYWILTYCCFYTVANIRHDEVTNLHFDTTNMNFSSLRYIPSIFINAIETNKEIQ